jgi:hypothetical protein
MWSTVANADPDYQEERTKIDLLAPGDSVQVLDTQTDHLRNGNSYSAPHVTGAIALLHQYYQQQKDAGNQRFIGPLKHFVTKAILMNSADKLLGVQGSSRDVYNSLNQKWDQTQAYLNDEIPLDASMGAGALNVQRAITQIAPGAYQRHIPNTDDHVPLIGWANEVIGPGETNEYILDPPVGDGTWATITLCWDRDVQHSGGNTYHYGDEFFPYSDPSDRIPDLDLSLVAMTSNEVVAQSISIIQTEEHIFFKTTGTDRYKIVVTYAGGLQEQTEFGLAWWIGNAPPVSHPGDFNGDGNVDGADYVTWHKDPASYGGAGGYDEWRTNFGVIYGSGSGNGLASVPEPFTAWLMIAGLCSCCCIRNKRLWTRCPIRCR